MKIHEKHTWKSYNEVYYYIYSHFFSLKKDWKDECLILLSHLKIRKQNWSNNSYRLHNPSSSNVMYKILNRKQVQQWMYHQFAYTVYAWRKIVVEGIPKAVLNSFIFILALVWIYYYNSNITFRDFVNFKFIWNLTSVLGEKSQCF